MPPPQCPECGRFLATAFVEQITSEPAPCPGCGTELSLAPQDPDDEGDDAQLDVEDDATTEPAATEAPDGEDVPADDGPPLTPAAAGVAADVEPEPTTSVRPPDRDPLEGWDQSGTLPAPTDELDPVELAVGAGAGLLLGLLLGGRDHRGLGALLGALLGAVVTRLRH